MSDTRALCALLVLVALAGCGARVPTRSTRLLDVVFPDEPYALSDLLPDESPISLVGKGEIPQKTIPNKASGTETETKDEAILPADEDETKVDYSGAQLWQVGIETTQNILIINNLTQKQAISVWGGNHTSVDILVKGGLVSNISQILRSSGVPFNIVIDDIQKNIDEENPPLDPEEIDLQNRKGHRMTWQQYHRLSDIHGFLDYLATTYPNLCTVMTIGQSHQGRNMKVLKISNGNKSNKAIWIDGGIHAREWISPATVTYILNHFVENNEAETDDIRNTDWYFLPVVNPDGYEYSHTNDRLWRKNRKGFGSCAGIDLNRNFGYQWGGQGTSKFPCSEIYAGTKAFSEPESKAMADFILHSSADFRAYISYHSYGQYLLYPWGYDKVVPEDYKDLDNVGNQMAQVIEKYGGKKYTVGTSSIVLYPAAGASDDWAKAAAKIKYSYTIELSDTGKYGFVLPASYIQPVAKESLAAIRVLAEVINKE